MWNLKKLIYIKKLKTYEGSTHRKIFVIVNIFSCIPYNFDNADRNRMCRVNPRRTVPNFKRAGRIPKDTISLILSIYILCHAHYHYYMRDWVHPCERTNVPRPHSERREGSAPFARPPFRLTSDKRPEGSQRRFHESYWHGRKTERRDVVDE